MPAPFARRTLTGLILFAAFGFTAATAARADEAEADGQALEAVFNHQIVILSRDTEESRRRVLALQTTLTIVEKTKSAALAERLVVALTAVSDASAIRVDAQAALGGLLAHSLLLSKPTQVNNALDLLAARAKTDRAGFHVQAAAVTSLSRILSMVAFDQVNGKAFYASILGHLRQIATLSSVDPTLQLAATSAVVAKGNQIQAEIKKLQDAVKTADDTLKAADTEAKKTAAENAKKAAEDKLNAEKARTAEATRGIWSTLNGIFIGNADSPASEFASRSLQKLIQGQVVVGVPAVGMASSMSGSTPVAATPGTSTPGASTPGTGTTTPPTTPAVDLSFQPLAVTDIPTITLSNRTMGVSTTRPYDAARDAVNTGKRVHSENLPSTSDQARKARSGGASGAFGISFKPYTKPKTD